MHQSCSTLRDMFCCGTACLHASVRNIYDFLVFKQTINYWDLFILEGFRLLLLDWLLFKLLISSILNYILLQSLGVVLVVRRIWSDSDIKLRPISKLNKFIFIILLFFINSQASSFKSCCRKHDFSRRPCEKVSLTWSHSGHSFIAMWKVSVEQRLNSKDQNWSIFCGMYKVMRWIIRSNSLNSLRTIVSQWIAILDGCRGVFSWCVISWFYFFVTREFRKLLFVIRDLKFLRDSWRPIVVILPVYSTWFWDASPLNGSNRL